LTQSELRLLGATFYDLARGSGGEVYMRVRGIVTWGKTAHRVLRDRREIRGKCCSGSRSTASGFKERKRRFTELATRPTRERSRT